MKGRCRREKETFLKWFIDNPFLDMASKTQAKKKKKAKMMSYQEFSMVHLAYFKTLLGNMCFMSEFQNPRPGLSADFSFPLVFALAGSTWWLKWMGLHQPSGNAQLTFSLPVSA